MKAAPASETLLVNPSQASALPFRIGESGPEFCLITTRRSNRWGFPKGQIRRSESVSNTALNEALEEAGLTGRIIDKPLGSYTYSKNRKKQTVVVLLMEVFDCRKTWKESSQRKRRWVSAARASELLDRPNLLELLQVASDRIQSNGARPTDGSLGA